MLKIGAEAPIFLEGGATLKRLMTSIMVGILTMMLITVSADANSVSSSVISSDDTARNTSLGTSNQNSSSTSSPVTITQKQYEKNIKGVKKRSFDSVIKMANSGRSFILFIGFSECPHCRKFSPVMNKFLQSIKYRAKVYYLNMNVNAALPSMSKKKIYSFNKVFQKPFEFIGTPTVVVIHGGHAVAGVVGDITTLDQLNQLLNVYLNIN